MKTKQIQDEILEKLQELKDEKYRNFSAKLIPNTDPNFVIGVRVPLLTKYAKQLANHSQIDVFLSTLPHKFHEENVLQVMLINQISDFSTCINTLEKFLTYIENWAVCDSLRPKVFAKNTEKLLPYIKKWLKSEHEYTVRFGIEILMSLFQDKHFRSEIVDLVVRVRSQKYYVQMMQAWFFATLLAKRYDQAIVVLQNKKLDVWVHNKTIQKAVESYRITETQKDYLKTLKIK